MNTVKMTAVVATGIAFFLGQLHANAADSDDICTSFTQCPVNGGGGYHAIVDTTYGVTFRYCIKAIPTQGDQFSILVASLINDTEGCLR